MSQFDFQELLRSAEDLVPAPSEGYDATTKVEDLKKPIPSWPIVLESATNLWSRVAAHSGSDAQNIKATLILGLKGIDLPNLNHKLDKIVPQKTFELSEPKPHPDVHTFLKTKGERNILKVLEDSKDSCLKKTEKVLWDAMELDWRKQQKKTLINLLKSKREFVAVGLLPSPQDPQPVPYLHHVVAYNKRILGGIEGPSLLHTLRQAADTETVAELWSLLACMSQAKDKISAAKRYLQRQFRARLEQAVPSGEDNYSRVRVIVSGRVPRNILGLEDGPVDGLPIWPLLYYCIRSGDLKAALEVAQRSPCVEKDQLCSALQELVTNPKSSPHFMKSRQRHTMRTCNDPFKKAVYALLGGTGVIDDYSDLCQDEDDYLWFRLHGFSQMRSAISVSPLARSRLLLLTGHWEAGLDAMPQDMQVHTVHMAVALHQLGLVATPDNHLSPRLCLDQDGRPRLNVARLVLVFVSGSGFSLEYTLHYYYLLRSLRTPAGDSLFLSCVVDLAVDTMQFHTLFGRLVRGRQRSRGLVDQFTGSVETTVLKVADRLLTAGSSLQAMTLYYLCGRKTDRMLTLWVSMACAEVHKVSEPDSLRQNLKDLISDFLDRYSCPDHFPAYLVQQVHLTNNFMEFFDMYHLGNLERALEIVDKLGFIPATLKDVSKCLVSWNSIPEAVYGPIPHLFLAIMRLYRAKSSVDSVHQDLWQIRIDSLINMAALIAHIFPDNISDTLKAL